jgi:hypothetical protein
MPLDDVVGHERGWPMLPGSLVLVTSHKHRSALKDARLISLDTKCLPKAGRNLGIWPFMALRQALDLSEVPVRRGSPAGTRRVAERYPDLAVAVSEVRPETDEFVIRARHEHGQPPVASVALSDP